MKVRLSLAAAIALTAPALGGVAPAQVVNHAYCMAFRSDMDGGNPATFYSEVFLGPSYFNAEESAFDAHVGARHDNRAGSRGATCARNHATRQAAEDALNRSAMAQRNDGRRVVFTRWRP